MNPDKQGSYRERVEVSKELQKDLAKDTGNIELKKNLAWLKDTSRRMTERELYDLKGEGKTVIQFGSMNYKTLREYDSLQKLLPKEERHDWFMRRLTNKQIEINNKYRENPEVALKKLGDSILNRLPYMLFVSLPLFALILRLIYIRRRKQFFFADHGVFTIHLYVFSFLLLMLLFGLSALQDVTGWMFLEGVAVILFIALFIYLYIAMRNFYRQGWAKTFLKFILVSILSFIMMIVLFLFFIFFSAFTL